MFYQRIFKEYDSTKRFFNVIGIYKVSQLVNYNYVFYLNLLKHLLNASALIPTFLFFIFMLIQVTFKQTSQSELLSSLAMEMFKLFCPQELITNAANSSNRSGSLLGTRSKDCICITQFLPSYPEADNLWSGSHLFESHQNLKTVGFLIISDSDPPPNDLIFSASRGEPSDDKRVVIVVNRNFRILSTLLLTGKERSDQDHVLFLFQTREFVNSFVLDSVDAENKLIYTIRNSIVLPNVDSDSPSTSTKQPSLRQTPRLTKFLEFGFVDEIALMMSVLFLNIFLKITNLLKIPRLPQFAFMESIACMPSSYIQLRQRSTRLQNHVASVVRDSSRVNQHIFKSFVWMLALDTFIGIATMFALRHFDISQELGEFLICSAEWIGIELEKLLSWLVDDPVGLKLNKPFAKFLSHFFLHHVNLWRAYINLLQPMWGTILHLSTFSGIFGFSLQMAILRDVISTMTIHVYCFYVYAARLYNLQLSALTSLWRLFRGRKWNGLMNRVDSTFFDIDSMFLGTLCFTILFFLLPTTLLFYVVFAALRLAVLVVQWFLGLMIDTVEGLPLYWVYLKTLRKEKVTGSPSLTVIETGVPFCLLVKLNPVSLKELIALDSFSSASSSSPSSSSSSSSAGVMAFLEKLLTGKLICPWIEKS